LSIAVHVGPARHCPLTAVLLQGDKAIYNVKG
jgi:hypothetical protein